MIENRVPPNPNSQLIWPWVDFKGSLPLVGATVWLALTLAFAARFFLGCLDQLNSQLSDLEETITTIYLLFGLSVLWILTLALTIIIRRHRWPSRVLFAALVPFPLAVIALIFLARDGALLTHRFNGSHDELHAVVRTFEETGTFPATAGSFDVLSVDRRDGCIFVQTDYVHTGRFEYAGFAYCTGSHPILEDLSMSHMRDDWWKYYYSYDD